MLPECEIDLQYPNEDRLRGQIYFSINKVNIKMKENLTLVGQYSNGRKNPKIPSERLQHLWEFHDGLTHTGWSNPTYRLMYQKVVLLWNSSLKTLG